MKMNFAKILAAVAASFKGKADGHEIIKRVQDRFFAALPLTSNQPVCPGMYGAQYKPNQRKRRLAARRRGF